MSATAEGRAGTLFSPKETPMSKEPESYVTARPYPLPASARTTIEPGDVEWDLDWSGLQPDGSRKYPNKPLFEHQFEPEGALALLLLNKVIFLNSHHWEESWPPEARASTSLNVNCNDIFAWGCADDEPLTYADIESLYQYWKKDPQWGADIWCIIKRKQLPQQPVLRDIQKAGIWDLPALTTEHKLRPNYYDGISDLLARKKYVAYCVWCVATGTPALPFQRGWWDGWKLFTQANIDWNSPEWEQEEKALIAQWRAENGWEPLQSETETEAEGLLQPETETAPQAEGLEPPTP